MAFAKAIIARGVIADRPAAATHREGMLYQSTDESPNRVYRCNGSSWDTYVSDGADGAAGSTGATGATGPAGATWYTGSGAPSGGTGVNGDYCIRSNGDVYQKSGGSWGSVLFSLVGPTGATGSTGAAGADGADGADGLSVNWTGAWSGATAYVVNDAVSLNGSSYICILGHTNHTPPNGTYWNVLAAKGTDGAGAGDMLAATYDPGTIAANVYDVDNHVNGTTNKVYTATEKTKLAGIAASADVTASALAPAIDAATGKSTPVDADELGLADSAASFALKKLTWANLKATLKTYLDTLYQPLAARLTTIASLTRTRGALIRGSATDWEVVTLGGAGQRLKSDGTDAVWGDDYVMLPFIIDGGGSVITTGTKRGFPVPDDYTIVEVIVGADQSGSIVIDIWKDSYANYPPTVADTITASAKPTLSSATKNRDTALTGWTTSLSAGDWLFYNVDSVTTITWVCVALRCKKRS